MSYIKRYNDSDFALPAPVVDLTFSNPRDSTKSQKINDVLLDSGADMTQIPAKTAGKLDLISNERMESFDYEGISVGIKLIYPIRVSFGYHSILGTAMETSGAPILGRNVLNLLTMFLHGPDKTLEIL